MVQLLLAVIYLAFISLGLPDSVLGSAWPSMYEQIGVPISYAGVFSVIIALGTTIASLKSDRLTRKFGTGKVTTISVAITAIALFGFSSSQSFVMLCLWSIPYGLGAGSVDASLNNYVAVHYASRHMSWLHCMWGVGASLGPYIMGYALSGGYGWSAGYRTLATIQTVLTVMLICSLPLWNRGKKQVSADIKRTDGKTHTISQIMRISGVKEVMLAFFCYCAIEQTTGLWASSYLTVYRGFPAQQASSFVGLYFVGITVGRALCGFLTIRLRNAQLVRLGEGIIALGLLVFLLPWGMQTAAIGLVLIGLGCAPIYPCIIHATPECFGLDLSQSVIGLEMASAYVGVCIMPPLFGAIAAQKHMWIFPFYLAVVLIVMISMYEMLQKKQRKDKTVA